MTSLERVADCGRGIVPGREVTILKAPDGIASLAGVMCCGSVWACPVCSAKIRTTKAAEIEVGTAAWVGDGHALGFLTLTVRHGRGDDLRALFGAVQDAWRQVRESRKVRRLFDVLGVAGFVKAAEITWGGYAGWHPHLHLLLFLESSLSRTQLRELEEAIYPVWADAMERHGFGRPDRKHGVRLDRVAANGARSVAEYVAKVQDEKVWTVAAELTRADVKRGRGQHLSPFQIAERAVAGDGRFAALWRTYATATKGRRAIEWSRNGLRDRLGLGQEQTDETLAAQEETAAVVAVIPPHDWANVVRYKGMARLLDLADDQGFEGVWSYLFALRRRHQWERERRRR